MKGNTMIVKWSSKNNPFKDIDPLLVPRAMAEFGRGAEEYNIRPVGSVPGGVRIDTRKVHSAQALTTWLESVGAVLVTAEPSDMAVLCDHKMQPEALGALRNWPTERFSDLLVEELTPAVRQLFYDSYTGEGPDGSDEIGAVQIKQIESDLAAVGLPIPAATNRLEQNLVVETAASDERYKQYAETPETTFNVIDNYGANL